MSQKQAFLDAFETRIVDQHEGSNPLFVLIPGLGAEGEIYSAITRYLKKRDTSYIVIEPPGFGNRKRADSNIELEGAAAIVIASGILPNRPTIYVGHSAGSMIALELARRDPNARGVVMVNGVLDTVKKVITRPFRYVWRYPKHAWFMAGLLLFIMGRLPKFVLRRLETPGHLLTWLFWPMVARPRLLDTEGLRNLVRHNRCRGAFHQLKANRHYDLTVKTKRLTVPIEVIHGTRDPLSTPPDKSEFLKECVVPVDIIKFDTGHCIPFESPESAADALIAFGDRIS